jgi:signal transduction histidine kinase
MSFRQALAWAGLVMLAGLCVMALALGAALKRADSLLDQLSRSQAQLAQAARIQADVNAFAADRTPASAEVARARLSDYRRSIDEESRALGPGAAAAPHQAQEQARAGRIADLFERIAAAPQAASAADLEQFRALTAEVQSSEQEEAAASLATMARLRAMAVGLAVGVPVTVALLGAIGFALLTAGVVRPLRRLEQATEGLGGETPGEVAPQGFAEFRRLAEAFNRMADQIAGQRRTLSQSNRDLENQVRERTREIEAARQRLADVDSARRLFLSKVSHELRTPATVVRGEAEVALRDPAADAARLREALEHVVANGAFLQRRLDDLLALARSEDGRLSVRREPVDLARLGRQVATLAESYVRSSEVELYVDLPAGPGPTVDGDASWLQQALLALLDNAAKFAGGTQVRLSLRREGDEAVFTVADGGPGVAADDLPHLFDSYYQTAQGRDRGGAGLGLSVAHWVAEQHGGAIYAEAGAAGGLSIVFRLPISETRPA